MKMPNYHLAILKRPYLEAILNGSKTIESRFTKTRRSYFGHISAGDNIFLKYSSGPVCATAIAQKVESYENLAPEKIEALKLRYNHNIRGTNEYWQSKIDCEYGSLIWLGQIEPIQPIRIQKKDWRAWVVLTEKENFGLLESGCIETARKMQKNRSD